jgi:hypothetical protein
MGNSLVRARWSFLQIRLPHDCRELLRFVEESQVMLEPLGYRDEEDFIRRGLKLDPVMVGWALEGLRTLSPDEPIPYHKAVELGMRGAPLGNQYAKKKEKDDKENKPDNVSFVFGNSSTYLTARLERDHPDILARLEAGEYTSVRC